MEYQLWREILALKRYTAYGRSLLVNERSLRFSPAFSFPSHVFDAIFLIQLKTR